MYLILNTSTIEKSKSFKGEVVSGGIIGISKSEGIGFG